MMVAEFVKKFWRKDECGIIAERLRISTGARASALKLKSVGWNLKSFWRGRIVRSSAHDWKSCVAARLPGVQIPPSPFFFLPRVAPTIFRGLRYVLHAPSRLLAYRVTQAVSCAIQTFRICLFLCNMRFVLRTDSLDKSAQFRKLTDSRARKAQYPGQVRRSKSP